MKVIHYISNLRSGGKERQLVELLKGFSEVEDIKCELLLMSNEIHYPNFDKLNIKSHFLIRKTRKDPMIFPRLYSLCTKNKPDVLHSWDSMCSVYAMPVVKLLGIKFVNGFLRDTFGSFSLHHKTWFRTKITFPFSDAIVANSLAGLKAYHVNPSKAHYVHNGFDMARVANLADPQQIKVRLGINTDKVVGMVATFSENKDHVTFIKAAQNILSKRNDVSFIMVGDGKNMKPCQDSVSPRFSSKIRFLGEKENVEEIVNFFSVGVLCSAVQGEGISNSIMEYMALRKPVVASDCAGNRELVVDSETGFLARQGNAEELTNKILQILDDDDLALRFGEAGHKRIINEFTMEKMVTQYANLYREILKR